MSEQNISADRNVSPELFSGGDLNVLSTRASGELAKLQQKLDGIRTSAELIDMLANDQNLARLFYAIDDGSSRFPLVPDYTFELFAEALSIASALSINRLPIQKFQSLLKNVGFTQVEQEEIVANLLKGRHPFFSSDRPALERELKIDLTDPDRLDDSIFNAAMVLGSSQLGVCLKIPVYREYLRGAKDIQSQQFLAELREPAPLLEKKELLEKIESSNPMFETRIETELRGAWGELRKELCVAIDISDVLDHLMNPTTLLELFSSLSMRCAEGETPASTFIDMAIQSLRIKIEAGERELFKEVTSHLEGAFAEIKSLQEQNNQPIVDSKPVIRLRYLDKIDDLIDCFRFADSKICCYSTPHYRMRIAHGVPNKEWKIAITKDPLFFIFQLEELPLGVTLKEASGRRHDKQRNLGFVFGSFGMDENKNLAVILNGSYLASGNNELRVSAIMDAIEDMLSRPIRAKVQITGSKAGGTIGATLPGYQRGNIDFFRLRALSDQFGKPQTKIYDDLGITINTRSRDFAFKKELVSQ